MVAPMHCLLDGQRELIKGLGPVVLATIGVLRPRLGDEGEDARDLMGRVGAGCLPQAVGVLETGLVPAMLPAVRIVIRGTLASRGCARFSKTAKDQHQHPFNSPVHLFSSEESAFARTESFFKEAT